MRTALAEMPAKERQGFGHNTRGRSELKPSSCKLRENFAKSSRHYYSSPVDSPLLLLDLVADIDEGLSANNSDLELVQEIAADQSSD